jgi:hypothetical protein
MVSLEPKTNQVKDINFPKTIKNAILYYICFAGVRADFVNKKDILESSLIPLKRKNIYQKQ